METHTLTDNEKELLTVLGKNPDLSIKELSTRINYKWTSTIVKKIEDFKKQSIVQGPVYDVNYDKLCKNPLHKMFCILELHQNYETVLPYILSIKPYAWVFPVLSPHKEFLNIGYYSSNDQEIKALLQLLKDNNIIADYMIRVYDTKRPIETPNFFGDSTPPLDHVLDPVELPDISLERHDTNWNECDIAILPYLSMGYKGAKLIEILKKERKMDRTWTYSQINYSREKMINNNLIERKYFVLPHYPQHCTYFFLFLKSENIRMTHRILYNFARNERVLKEYVLCKEWGLLFCVSHSSFLTELMHKLDQIKKITEKELYLLRSTWKSSPVSLPPKLKYFDVETQTLQYPYRVYREKIKEKIENEIG